MFKKIIVTLAAVVVFLGFGSACFAVDCPKDYWDVSGTCLPAGSGLPDIEDEDPIGVLLVWSMGWVFIFLGILGIIAFAISGIQYIVSAGNVEMIETAKRNMKWSIVGVVVGLSGYIIIQTIDALLR